MFRQDADVPATPLVAVYDVGCNRCWQGIAQEGLPNRSPDTGFLTRLTDKEN
jgi:hypothetical protein